MISIKEGIKEPLLNGTEKELSLIWIISKIGKKFYKKSEEFKNKFNSKDAEFIQDKTFEYYRLEYALETKSSSEIIEEIPTQLDNAFLEGTEFMDYMKERNDNYCKQLEITIEALIKSNKPSFWSSDTDYKEWVKKQKQVFKEKINIGKDGLKKIRRMEEFLVGFLLGAYILKLSPGEKKKLENELKKAFAKYVEKIGKDVNYDKIIAGILTGGITALRSIMGFQFHIILAITANSIARFLTGAGLSFTANWMMQKFAALLFGPWGWAIGAILFLWDITALINPRRYDRYIPSVVYIYFLRHKKELEGLDFINA